MTWGAWGKQFSSIDMIDLMHHCIENDITTFDHADIYGDYSTETEFGAAFANSGIQRDAIQLISKCGIQLISKTRSNSVKHYNYDQNYIIESAENSLKFLKTDYLDLLLIHRPSPLMHPDVISEAVYKLKKDGKIQDFGVSNFTPSQVEMISKSTAISANQIECSLTHETPMYDGTLDQMIAKEITPMAWSPLGEVFKEHNAPMERIDKQLNALTDKYSASKDQLLLAWLLKHPAKIHPVVGTTTKERLSNASKSVEIDLELEDWFLLLQARQGHEVP